MRRLRSLDLIRGAGILVVVFLHASLYQYDGLLALDLKNPPPVITVIGFMLMWAGLFAIVSGASHMFTWTDRIGEKSADPGRMRRSLLITGALLLVLNLAYFQLLGPTLLDIPGGRHQYALLNGLIETGRLPGLYWQRFFYNTSISMLGWNCILLGLLAPLLFPRGAARPGLRTPALLAGIGSALVLASYVRLPLYPVVEKAVNGSDLLTAFLGAALINKNDPLLPYLGFALIGAALGHAFASPMPRKTVTLWAAAFGVAWLAAGAVGYVLLPDTMLERSVDEMWFTIIVAQVGLFALLVALSWRSVDARAPAPPRRPGPWRLCGSASLTIFIWETPVRSLYARLWDVIFPGWSARIPVVLLFALTMVLIWLAAISLWKRARFVGSMEWLVGRIYAVLGRPSAKEKAFAAGR